MKRYPTYAFGITALFFGILIAASCTKEKNTSPALQQQKTAVTEDALEPGESNIDTLSFGKYTIIKFIDSGIDRTMQYDGYTFEFRANNVFVAEKGGHVFDGTWRMNNDNTKMMIDITGNVRLEDLDGNWIVAKLTDRRLSIVRKAPDKAVFKKLE
jgi:hypothetical protein